MDRVPSAIALVRPPSPSFYNALSSHSDKHSINIERAREQHRYYVTALKKLGVAGRELAPLDAFPDSTFVEDNAVVFEDCAVLCTMGAESRRGETFYTQGVLDPLIRLEKLEAPAYLDGGDVLQTEDTVFVGLSQRSNPPAIEALAQFTKKKVVPVRVLKGLHLKTAASYLGQNTILLDPECVEVDAFGNKDFIRVDASESYAANCLKVGNTVLVAQGFPDTRARIESLGLDTLEIPMGEFEKADGGLTCLSLFLPNQ